MQILHVIESDGGSADFIYFLAKYMPHCHHRILCGLRAFKAFEKLKEQFANSFPSNIDIIFWKNAERELRPIKDLKAVISLIQALKSFSFDLVHLHSSKAGFLGRLACRLLGIKKIVYTTHAISFLRKDVPDYKISLYKTLEKVGSNLGGTAVSCSESEKNELLKYGIPSVVIPNGTELQPEPSLNRNLNDKLTVGTVGRVTIQKNPELFNCIAKQFAENENIRFIWMGKGELEHLITSDNIEITGWLNKEQIYSCLNNIDIYISTASWEGMPLAVLEAMACGKPLILSDCIGNTDLIYEHQNGMLFNTVEEAVTGINLLATNHEQRNKMGTTSREMCKNNFDIKLTAQRYFSLYESLITPYVI